MKIFFVTCLLAFATIEPTSAFFQWIQCGLQTGRTLHRCVKSCKEQNPCQEAMDRCELGDQFLRLVCRAVMQCHCKSCLNCTIKCLVSDLYPRADCNYGKFITKIVKKLGLKTDLPDTEEGAIEGLRLIVGKITHIDLTENENVTIKPETESDEEDDEETEFDDAEGDDSDSTDEDDDDEDVDDDVALEASIDAVTEEPTDVVA